MPLYFLLLHSRHAEILQPSHLPPPPTLPFHCSLSAFFDLGAWWLVVGCRRYMSRLGWLVTGFNASDIFPVQSAGATQLFDTVGAVAARATPAGAALYVLDTFILTAESDVIHPVWPEFLTSVLRRKVPEVFGKTAAEAKLHDCGEWAGITSVELALNSVQIGFKFERATAGDETLSDKPARCGRGVISSEYEDICMQVLGSVANTKLIAAEAVYMCAADCAFQSGANGVEEIVIAVTLNWVQVSVAGRSAAAEQGMKLALALEADPLSVRWRHQIGKSFHVQPSERAIASGRSSEIFNSTAAFYAFTSGVTATSVCPDAVNLFTTELASTAPTTVTTDRTVPDPSSGTKTSGTPNWLHWLLIALIATIFGIMLPVCLCMYKRHKAREDSSEIHRQQIKTHLLERENVALQKSIETRLTNLP